MTIGIQEVLVAFSVYCEGGCTGAGEAGEHVDEHLGEQVLWPRTEMSRMQKPQCLWIYGILSGSHIDVYTN